MKRVNGDALKAGDIVLTANRSKLSKGIRLTTRGTVSHAMICVEHWSVIDSTADGVHSKNLQREIFEDDEEVSVFRLRVGLESCGHARLSISPGPKSAPDTPGARPFDPSLQGPSREMAASFVPGWWREPIPVLASSW